MVILRDESKIHERLAPLSRKSLIFTILVVRQGILCMNRRFIKIEENIEDILTRIEDSCLKIEKCVTFLMKFKEFHRRIEDSYKKKKMHDASCIYGLGILCPKTKRISKIFDKRREMCNISR